MFSKTENQQNTQEQTYVVLARRTRPQSLTEVVGQETIVSSFKNLLSQNKVPHAFLFTGTRGTGKTSTARILAKSLCCEKGPTAEPCQTCFHCVQITKCCHDDVMEIDGASNTGVDQIRQLKEAARFYPHSARYKIFIIDEVHMLSVGAFNALLKTLEEPPERVVFILATTELHKVPLTVRSRCQIFSFQKISVDKMVEHLQKLLLAEGVTTDRESLILIAREAKGSLRDALSLLEQAISFSPTRTLEFQNVKANLLVQGEEFSVELFQAICSQNLATGLNVLSQADQMNIDLSVLLDTTANHFRYALIALTETNENLVKQWTHLLPDELKFIKETATGISSPALSEIFKTLTLAAKEILRSQHALSWAEIAVVDCIKKREWLSASELLQKISGSGHNGSPITGGTATQSKLPSSSSSPNKTFSNAVSPAKASSSFHKDENETKDVIATREEIENLSSQGDVNIPLLREFLAKLSEHSQTLALRLQFVKFKAFKPGVIEFAEVAENKSYLSLAKGDLEILASVLNKMPEFQKANIINAPQTLTQLWTSFGGKFSATPPQSSGFKKAPLQSGPIPQTANSLTKGSFSLSGHEKALAHADHKLKESQALNQPHIRHLQKFASEINLLPLE